MSARYPFLRGSLHGYQHRIRADRSPVRLLSKARRVGGTYTVLGQGVEDSSRPNGRNTYVMSHTAWGGRESMRDALKWAKYLNAWRLQRGLRSLWIDGRLEKSVSATKIEFSSGLSFQTVPSSPRLLRGPVGAPHYILDEVAYHRDVEELFAAATPVVAMGAAAVTAISTVNGENAFWQYCEKVRQGKLGWSLHSVNFGQALNDGLYERVAVDRSRSPFAAGETYGIACPKLAKRLGLPHDPEATKKYREQVRSEVTDPQQELDCQPRRSADQYFAPALVRKRMTTEHDVIRWTAPDDDWKYLLESVRQQQIVGFIEAHISPIIARHRWNPPRSWGLGTDFGRSRDLTAMAWGYEVNGLLRVAFILELEDCPFDDQDFFFDQIKLRLMPARITTAALDRGTNGASHAEHVERALGPTVAEGVQTGGDAWDREYFPLMRRRLEQGSLELPHDELVVQDFCQVKLSSTGVPKVPRTRTKTKTSTKTHYRHADTVVAVQLLVYAFSKHPSNGGHYGVYTDDDLDESSDWGSM